MEGDDLPFLSQPVRPLGLSQSNGLAQLKSRYDLDEEDPEEEEARQLALEQRVAERAAAKATKEAELAAAQAADEAEYMQQSEAAPKKRRKVAASKSERLKDEASRARHADAVAAAAAEGDTEEAEPWIVAPTRRQPDGDESPIEDDNFDSAQNIQAPAWLGI